MLSLNFWFAKICLPTFCRRLRKAVGNAGFDRSYGNEGDYLSPVTMSANSLRRAFLPRNELAGAATLPLQAVVTDSIEYHSGYLINK
jgi:hypothetical protein